MAVTFRRLGFGSPRLGQDLQSWTKLPLCCSLDPASIIFDPSLLVQDQISSEGSVAGKVNASTGVNDVRKFEQIRVWRVPWG